MVGVPHTDADHSIMLSADDRSVIEALNEILAKIEDPEIPVISVVDLGIVRSVSADAVVITPTYTGCPATQVIEHSIRQALDKEGFHHVLIKTIIDPPWSTDWISETGRKNLLDYGIAPPPKGEGRSSLSEPAKISCPQCGSQDTQEVSEFGSTPCKALMKCNNCLEPFDRFKCL